MGQTVSDHERVDYTQVAMPPGYRLPSLLVVIVGHAAAAAAFFTAPWWIALAILLPTGCCVMWGTLYPHSSLFGPVMTRLPERARPVVWLTFDDGPSTDTLALLDVLGEYGAKATFFLVAQRAQHDPDRVKAIIDAGHDIGNHTDSHPAAWFWGLSPSRMAGQIDAAQSTLTKLAGRPPRWFRSVAGQTNPFVEPVLRRLGLSRASWTGRGFDTVDPDDVRVLRRLTKAISPGAILMLHEDAGRPGRCVRLLRSLLLEISTRGYATALPTPALTGAATTSQLLKGVRPQSGDEVTRRPNVASSDSRPSRVG